MKKSAIQGEKELRVALVTGAARRIGRAIAIELHQAGFNIVIHYRDSEHEALTLCDALNKHRADSAISSKLDLRQTAAIAPWLTKTLEKWGKLEVLINNASAFYPTPFANTTEAAWDDLFVANLKAPYFLSQAAFPYLIKTKGHIINITDFQQAKQALRNYTIYGMTKAGLAYLTRALAKELGPEIRVNAVAPGTVDWPEGPNVLDEQHKQFLINKTALKAMGTPQAIAKAVKYLCCDAEYTTGETLAVDGGRGL